MIRKHNRRAARAAFAISLGVAIVIGVYAAAFTRPAHATPKAGPTITIGTKNFGEEYILGQLYKQALQAKGFTVRNKGSLGSTELIQTALTSGKINFYPEYTGVVVQDVYHHASSPKTAAATYQLAKQLEAAKGITAMTPTPFFDTDVLAVTNATAKKYSLKSIGDLKKVGAFKLGGFPECKTRSTCFAGYTKQYGLTKASFVSLGTISGYVALDKGDVLAADVFSTDPPLGKPSKYTVLA
ncbi:MAG TPA: glycine betaine ABC transporter substrate-binding protein, partial [Gaiellaceae bacterium]|nr:glycine betaine ABC transporter substrate-binding protein [Gaiellaceae bacterium]